mmetsp:Transcript_23051/g.29842  ORF Transcript_23051/g.29842 Transcript_23051/m.29842 type:complete len:128 (+) Transcript_23051:30-413(+)
MVKTRSMRRAGSTTLMADELWIRSISFLSRSDILSFKQTFKLGHRITPRSRNLHVTVFQSSASSASSHRRMILPENVFPWRLMSLFFGHTPPNSGHLRVDLPQSAGSGCQRDDSGLKTMRTSEKAKS